jgi:hypothetical protein
MTSIIKVDTIQDQDGNNIINENANTITIGASGDTITIPAGATIDTSVATLTLPTTIEVDAIEPQSGTSLTIGASGDTITIPSGATITNSGTATGFGGGKVLQVVSTTVSASRSTSSATYVDISGASASITPSSASNKILVLANAPGAYASQASGGATCYGYINVVRTSTQINQGFTGWYISGGSGGQALGDIYAGISMITLDEPSTTSSTTYKLQFKLGIGTAFYAADSALFPISLHLIEIAG